MDDLLRKLRQARAGGQRAVQNFVRQPVRLPNFQQTSRTNRNPLFNGQLRQPTQQFINAAKQSVIRDFRQGIPSAIRVANPGLMGGRSLKQQGTDFFNTARVGSYALGAPRLATKVGATTLASSGLLGGALNKVTGGSFAEGAGQGVASAPGIMGITRLTNPVISRTVGRIAPRIAQNPAGKYLAASTARGALNVPEGALIDATLNRRPFGASSIALDFASGFIPGGNTKVGIRGKKFAKNQYEYMAKADKQQVADTINRILHNSQDPNYYVNQRPKDERFLLQMAEDYIGKGFVKQKKGNIQDIAQELLNRVRDEDNMSPFDLPGLGLVAKDQEKVESVGEIMEGGFQPGQGIKKTRIKNPITPDMESAGYKSVTDIRTDIKTQEEAVARLEKHLGKVDPKSVMAGTAERELKKVKLKLKQAQDFDSQVKTSLKKKDTKYTYNINKNRLDMDPVQRQHLEQAVNEIKPELEVAKGQKLSFDEVREEAKKADFLDKVVGRESTKNFEASLTATRDRLNTLNNEIERLRATGDTVTATRLTKELVDHIKVVSSEAADIGRKLGSFRITAQERPFREQLLEEIIKKKNLTDAQIDELTKRAAQVDFNNPQEVQKFYREFVQPTIGSLLEEYRYFNLLSSPLTHVVNTFSNAMQASVVRPATKLVSGVIDPIAASLGSKERENYIGEVPMYYRGLFASIPEAMGKVIKIYQGQQQVTNLDFKTLGRTPAKYNIVTKTLEASDQFFRTLIQGAEQESLGYKFGKMGKEVGDKDIKNLAEQQAQYYTYRQGLNNPSQGPVLNWVDQGTEAVLGLRNVKGVKWFIPFVQTPMNIFKQGVEYSPLGVATIPGAENKREQVSKAIVGSMVFAGAGYLALQDRLTWSAPRDGAQKQNFYAAGMQPYSVKLGNKWVSFTKMGPLAYPLALAAGIKYSFKDDPNAVANGSIDKISNSLMGIMGFFGDQSYMQGIGNIVGALEGQEGFTGKRIIASIPSQYIPASSFQRWVNNIIDPVYRKPDSFVDQLKSNVVGLTGGLGTYDNPFGEPSRRQYPIGNALNPFRVTKENEDFKELYDLRQEKLEANAITKFEKRKLEEEMEKTGLNPASAAEESGDDKFAAQRAKIKEDLARDKVKLKGGYEVIGEKIIYYDKESQGTKSIDLSDVTSLPSENKYQIDIKQKKAYSVANNIIKSSLPEKEKLMYLEKIGIPYNEAFYYNVASKDNNEKTMFVIDNLDRLTKQNVSQEDFLQYLANLRKSVNGNRIATDEVVENLVDDGYIPYDIGRQLKKLKPEYVDKKKTGGGGGRKKKRGKVAVPGFKAVPSVQIKLKQPKLAKIKLGRSKSKKKKVKLLEAVV